MKTNESKIAFIYFHELCFYLQLTRVRVALPCGSAGIRPAAGSACSTGSRVANSPPERTLRASGDQTLRPSASSAAGERVQNSKAPSRRWREVLAVAAARQRAQTRSALTTLTRVSPGPQRHFR